MMGIKINKRVFAIFICTILLYDCIFVDLKYEAEYRYKFSLFPPKFHNAVLSQNTTINPCADSHTCKLLQNQSFSACYCDRACQKYDDCCFDARFSDMPEPTTNKYQYIDIKYFTCESKIINNNIYGIWSVSSCPSNNRSTEIAEKCLLAENIHPVSSEDGTTFRNVYCAYCHDVRHFIAWQFEFYYGGNCPGREKELIQVSISKKMKYIIANCTYRFVPPRHAYARVCLRNASREAEQGSLCSSFQSPVTIDNKLYRNIHCYDKPKYRLKICMVISYDRFFGQKGYGSSSLTGIFNIRPVFDMLGQKKCEENFYYDATKDACVTRSCRDGKGEGCDAELIRNFKYRYNLQFVTNNLLDQYFLWRLVSFISLSLPTERYKTILDFVLGIYKCGRNTTSSIKFCCVGAADVFFVNTIDMTSQESKQFESDVTNMKWAYLEIRNQTSIAAFDLYKDRNLNNTCNVTGISKTFDQHHEILKETQSKFVHNMKTKWNEVPKDVQGVVIITDGALGSEPVYKLEQWKVEFVTKNDTNDSNLYIISEDEWSVGTILTYATLGMSCCFLVLTIIVYGYFGLFRSTAGVITKYMMVTMLAAQFVFIAGVGATYVKTVCTVIGIVSHYLWLTSFTWISIFLLSVSKMIRTLYTSPGALASDQKLSKVVCVFGFLLPFVIVLPCALLDVLTEVDIGYSDGNICFPTGSISNLFFFTLPVIISLFINIITLVISAVLLSRFNSTVQVLQSVQQVRSFIPIYTRLVILCACPWILGIIADIFQIESLRYIFILLSGSHGTFVGVSFLLAKSVRSQVRGTKPSVES